MRSSVDTACSGSSEEIKIGAGVLDYISELGNIQAKILEAYTYREQCVQNIESEDTYQGEAREEMLASVSYTHLDVYKRQTTGCGVELYCICIVALFQEQQSCF